MVGPARGTPPAGGPLRHHWEAEDKEGVEFEMEKPFPRPPRLLLRPRPLPRLPLLEPEPELREDERVRPPLAALEGGWA